MNKIIKDLKKEIEEYVLNCMDSKKYLRKTAIKYLECYDTNFNKLKAKLQAYEDAQKMICEEIKSWEKENKEVLKTEDIIKEKIILADYVKWNQIRELLKKFGGKE